MSVVTADRMRRLRLCLANTSPGRPGSAFHPPLRGTARKSFDAQHELVKAAPEAGLALSDIERKSVPGSKSPRWSAQRRASGGFRTPAPQDADGEGAARRSLPSLSRGSALAIAARPGRRQPWPPR